MSPRAAAIPLLLAAAGCHGCHDDHPYVPYTIQGEHDRADASVDAVPLASSSPASAEGGPAIVAEPALTAPPGTARWSVGGLVLDAPAGTTFVSGIVHDMDGDGAADAFAVVRSAEGTDPGQLVFYQGAPRAPADAPLAAQATFGPPTQTAHECPSSVRLIALGAHSVLVELGAPCPARPSSQPDRWIAVATAGSPARLRMAFSVGDPSGAPSLSVDADTADRDGDGREDIAFRVAVEGGGAPFEPGPRVTATLAWLDRPAGWSRDAGATESSFASLASQASARARSAREAATVPGFVRQIRLLWSAMCADSGAPRLVGIAGTGPIPCGATRALEDAGLAEVRSDVTSGVALHAALALDRAEAAPAAHSPSKVAEARTAIESIAPVVRARAVRAVAAVPLVGKGHEPSWGSLAFEPSGKLLVRTRAGVVRVDPDTGDEAAADDVAAWPSAVVSPDRSLQWIEAYDACDGVALRATFSSGDDVRDVALPVAPPPGLRCVGSRGAAARVVPIAWGPAGLEAVVEGQPVLVAPDVARASLLAAPLDSPFLRGSPRSPDGKTLVVATSAGLLVLSSSRARLLRSTELDATWSDERDCAVSNDGAHVACVRAGRAWAGGWDVP
jgi:hypothetical protein